MKFVASLYINLYILPNIVQLISKDNFLNNIVAKTSLYPKPILRIYILNLLINPNDIMWRSIQPVTLFFRYCTYT